MKSVVRIFLKNGVQLPDVVCNDFGVNISGGDVTGYEYKGAKYPRPIYINPGEIAAVYEMGEKEDCAVLCLHGFAGGCDEMNHTAARQDSAQYSEYACPYSKEGSFQLCPLWPHKGEKTNG